MCEIQVWFSIFCVYKLPPQISFLFPLCFTILSLMFYYILCSDHVLPLENRNGQYVWEDHRPRSGIWKGTNGGDVISLSGCDDDQTSADTSVSFMKGKKIKLAERLVKFYICKAF